MRRRSPRVLLTVALATLATLVLLAGCGGSDDTTEAQTATTALATDPADESADDGDDVAADAPVDGEAGDADETTDSAGADATDDATDEDGAGDAVGTEELFPDVVGASASLAADGSWTFQATLSSPYDTPERYADAWRVVGPDGEVYGIRELAHDHANEQPFTRSQSGIVIPDGVDVVTVEGRDQVSGWGGATVEVELER